MRTGRALTVSGEGGGGGWVWCIPEEILEKKIEKKKKKNLETPQKFGDPPEKLETPQDQTPPPVDRHTLVKILPWPNFVAAGKMY